MLRLLNSEREEIVGEMTTTSEGSLSEWDRERIKKIPFHREQKQSEAEIPNKVKGKKRQARAACETFSTAFNC
jgi:hypothetical protein